MTFNLINPNDFQVARVISFYDSTINRNAKVCYFRPMKNGYNKTTFDDFDKSMRVKGQVPDSGQLMLWAK